MSSLLIFIGLWLLFEDEAWIGIILIIIGAGWLR